MGRVGLYCCGCLGVGSWWIAVGLALWGSLWEWCVTSSVTSSVTSGGCTKVGTKVFFMVVVGLVY